MADVFWGSLLSKDLCCLIRVDIVEEAGDVE